jgi:hypothetical protein
MLVRGLGLVPVINPSEFERFKTHTHEGRKTNKLKFRLGLVLTVAMLLTSYGILAVAETYSKRSCLGCVYPVFIFSWFIFAIVPAACETIVSTRRRNKNASPMTSPSNETPSDPELPASDSNAPHARNLNSPSHSTAINDTSSHPKNCHESITIQATRKMGASSIQGSDEIWIVQFLWAVYYAAGTLIYTSIMAVTVIELFVWVVATLVTTSLSRLLGYKLCRHCLRMAVSSS